MTKNKPSIENDKIYFNFSDNLSLSINTLFKSEKSTNRHKNSQSAIKDKANSLINLKPFEFNVNV